MTRFSCVGENINYIHAPVYFESVHQFSVKIKYSRLFHLSLMKIYLNILITMILFLAFIDRYICTYAIYTVFVHIFISVINFEKHIT
mgnify:CR=1 FL=1